MKRLLKGLCAIGALVLFGWVCSALVTSSESFQAPEPHTPVTRACLTHPDTLPLDPAVPSQPRDKNGDRLGFTDDTVRSCIPAEKVTRDNNGWLITGKTWHGTVYTACPPEGVPG